MKSFLAVLFLAVPVFAQGTVQDPETKFQKVDAGLSSLTKRVYLLKVDDPDWKKLGQESTTDYADGELEAVHDTLPIDDIHHYRRKLNADGKGKERSEYDSSDQMITRWTYERAADGSFKVTEVGKTSKTVWSYNSDGKLENAELSDDGGVYSRIVDTYKDGRLIVSEDRSVKDSKETLFRKTEYTYWENGKLKSADSSHSDGTMGVMRQYNDKGDLTLIQLCNIRGEVTTSADYTPEYQDNGHGEEKVAESWELSQGEGEDKMVKMRGRVEYERVYKK